MKSNVTNIMAAFVSGQVVQTALAVVGANTGFNNGIVFGAISGLVITLSMFAGAYIASGSGNAKHAAKPQQAQQRSSKAAKV